MKERADVSDSLAQSECEIHLFFPSKISHFLLALFYALLADKELIDDAFRSFEIHFFSSLFVSLTKRSSAIFFVTSFDTSHVATLMKKRLSSLFFLRHSQIEGIFDTQPSRPEFKGRGNSLERSGERHRAPAGKMIICLINVGA